ncbi:MAG: hypothetical protein ACI8ZM_002313 [Crocinitomix sp.]|jgi:hypothetical protein
MKMLKNLLIFFVLFGSQQNANAQGLYPIDSCGFYISDTLDQGCAQYNHGFIWTYSDCEIHDFRILVTDRKGRVVYYDNDINKRHETYKIWDDDFRGSQTFYWRATGFVLVNGVERKINWEGRLFYWG